MTDRSYRAVVKREIRLVGRQLAFTAKKLGELDIIVDELSSNLVKYASNGELLVRPIPDAVNAGIELISVDSGPGMADPDRMLVDGVSTGNSLGQGLGAIQRLASEFQLYSIVGKGTVVLARLYQKARSLPTKPPAAIVRWVILPKPGEVFCGDGYYVKLTISSLTLFLGDGLGHGMAAQAAVEQAIQTLKQTRSTSPAQLLTAVHQAVVGTRGLVGTAAIFDFTSRKWTICGVGNIMTQWSGLLGTKHYSSHNGILGYNIPGKLVEQEMPFEREQWLIMTSDGLRLRWSPGRYPGINKYDPSVLAAVIYKAYARHTDDMAVLVCKVY